MKLVKNVFVIDDDPIHRLLMNKLFEKQDNKYTLHFFENGKPAFLVLQEALASNLDNIPDLILLDIEMPVMNGWQFMAAFKELEPLIPQTIDIYMVSSSFSDQDQQKIKSFPTVKDYLIKPIRLETIIKILS